MQHEGSFEVITAPAAWHVPLFDTVAVVSLVVVFDLRTGNEAIYIDGELSKTEQTFYACDIVDAAKDRPVSADDCGVGRLGY